MSDVEGEGEREVDQAGSSKSSTDPTSLPSLVVCNCYSCSSPPSRSPLSDVVTESVCMYVSETRLSLNHVTGSREREEGGGGMCMTMLELSVVQAARERAAPVRRVLVAGCDV